MSPSPTTAAALALAFAVAALATAVLPGAARHLGWVDAARGAPDRKLQRRPVPAVGGAICLAGVLAGWALCDHLGRGPGLPLPGRGLGRTLAPILGHTATIWPLGGVLTGFAVGLLDDLIPGGLGAGVKLAGQGLAGLVLGLPLVASTTAPPEAVVAALGLLAFGAVLATNAINTFDNADGAAGTLCFAGFLVPAPLVSAALAPFLVRNLRRGRGGEVSAYLGDSGSHLLGMLVLATPAAWPLLVVPSIDLARVARERLEVGRAPWVGDRRHLAHRLARAGLGRVTVPLALAGLALPGLWLGVAGLAASAVGTLLVARWAGGRGRVGAEDEAPPVGLGAPGDAGPLV